MKKLICKLLLISLLFIPNSIFGNNLKTSEIVSPNGKLKITIKDSNMNGIMSYTVNYNGKVLVSPSEIGLVLKSNPKSANNTKISKTTPTASNTTWQPPYGDRKVYKDNYRGLVLKLSNDGKPSKYDIEVRAYNEGVAYRYLINDQNDEITKELSEFAISPNAYVWHSSASQSVITKDALKDVKTLCERPMVGCINNTYFALGEAAQINYPRSLFKVNNDKNSALTLAHSGTISTKNLKVTPWRYIMAADKPGTLLENNFLLLNLNEPSKIKDTKFLVPGKVIRDVTLTTEGGKACVDFAVKHNLQYVIESAGWYGNEFLKESDASTATLDPKRSKGPFDLNEIIRYGNEKGVGIMVYVNRNQLEKQLDEILPLYHKWGIKGIKYGFVRVGTQKDSNWNYYSIQQAAKYNMVLSIHDDLRPTGYQRTYPNWMTCEGIRGDEESPVNSHTIMTVFTRCIAGAADNTVCYFADRVEKMGSHASQMAKTICIYSPLQWLYWYDRPEKAPINSGEAGGSYSIIKEIPDLKFFDELPTVWDNTKVLNGEIGEYVTIARQKGNNWFIGCINGENKRNISFDLSFLKPNQKYQATIFYDDKSMNTETNIRIKTFSVNSKSKINREVLRNNGFVMQIKKI